jgi:hypothetical protein
MTKIGYEPPPGACYLPELDPRNQPRAYTRLTYDGSSAIMDPAEADALMREEPGVYASSEARMTLAEFEKLPEFTGW